MLKHLEEITEKKITKRAVYRLLHNRKAISKNEIHQELGGSLSNISRHLSELESDNLIIHYKGSGRTPGSYQIVETAGYALGGYANGEVYGIGLCDISGKVLEIEERFFTPQTEPSEITNFFHKYKALFLQTDPIIGKNYLGAGFGFTGPLRRKVGILMHPHLIPNWTIVPIKDFIEVDLEEDVQICPWTESALIGEIFFENHDPDKTTSLLWLDKGIGVASANGGQMNLDKPEQSSALGHQVVNFKGPECSCGKHGCLNTYCTIQAIYGRLSPFFPEGAPPLTNYTKAYKADPWKISPELELLAKAFAESKDRIQTEGLLSEIEEAFNSGLSNYLFITRPDNLILSGRLAIRFQEKLTRIVERASDESNINIRFQSSLTFLDITREKMVRGGAALTFNKYLGFIN